MEPHKVWHSVHKSQSLVPTTNFVHSPTLLPSDPFQCLQYWPYNSVLQEHVELENDVGDKEYKVMAS
jgi:hypothetical protein